MRVPLPEFAGNAAGFVVVEVVEPEVELEPVFVVEAGLPVAAALVIGARTLGAVASACAASTPTPTNATIVIISTENVAPRPAFGRVAGRCGAAPPPRPEDPDPDPDPDDEGLDDEEGPADAGPGDAARDGVGPDEDGPDAAARPRCPAALVPLPMRAIMPYRRRTG